MTPEQIAERLAESGLCVIPDFLSPEEARALRADLEALRAAGEFHRAHVGKGANRQIQDEIRRDEVCWLERDGANEVQRSLLARIDALKQPLGRVLLMGLADFEGHYASYPAGGFYKRHLDSFRNDNARVVSVVLYLNENWQPGDGGELKLYGKDDVATLVEPRGGALVCFLSRETEHEVLASQRVRLSFTGWFKTR